MSDKRNSKDELRLTKSNWNTTFKTKFKHEALKHGEAGEIIVNDKSPVIEEPKPVKTAEGYTSQYRDQLKRYRDFKEGKKTLISKLLEAMDPDVYEGVSTSPEFEKIFADYDLLKMWQLTEQVVMGRGDVSVYTLIIRFLQCKQEGSYMSFEKEFKELVKDLNAHGTPEEILEKIYNAIFIMALDREQFKEQLTRIFGARDWPKYEDLAAELHIYAESTEKMSALTREQDNLKVNANAVVTANQERKREATECWNCGSKSHLRAACDADQSKCTKCGKSGHLARYCFGERQSKRSELNESYDKKLRKKPTSSKGDGRKEMKKKGKVSQVKKMLSKIVASLADLEDDTNDGEESEEEDNNDNDHDEDDDEVDDDDDDWNAVKGCIVTCDINEYDDSKSNQALSTKAINIPEMKQPVHNNAAMLSNNKRYVNRLKNSINAPRRYVIDSGCRGAHVVKDASVLESSIDTSKWKRMPSIYGISGHSLETTKAGYLAPIDGITLVTPEASSNLLSLMEMVKTNGGSFSGDKNHILIKDSKGRTILKGINTGDDFWTCDEEDLTHDIKSYIGNMDAVDVSSGTVNSLVSQATVTAGVGNKRYFSAEERVRAQEAYRLCELLRHPGDETVISSLDHGVFPGTHLTSQDYRNARTIFGPCPACTEGKMRAPSEPLSLSEPARTIGERVHSDLIILKNKCIGGATIILVTTDEKSSYIVGVPCVSKSEPIMRDAAIAMVSEFNTFGHRIKQMTTDDEHSLQTLKKHLGPYGIQVTATPAGLHEKRVESRIRAIKDRMRSMLAGLPYELPTDLECEAYMDAIAWLNKLPNSTTGQSNTAYHLVTQRKAALPQYYFGQCGLFYNQRKDHNQRSEWGIFIGYGANQKYLRCYNPVTKSVTSRRKFVPQPEYPPAWGLKPRIKAVQQLTQGATSIKNTQLTRNLNVQTGKVPITNIDRSVFRSEHVDQSTTAIEEDDTSEGERIQSVTDDTQEGDTMSTPVEVNAEGEDATVSIQSNEEGDKTVEPTVEPQQVGDQTGTVQSAQEGEQLSVPIKDTPIATREEEQSSRPRRANKGNWKDGPSHSKNDDLITSVRKKTKGINAFLALNSDAVGKVPILPTISAMKTSLRQALRDEKRRDVIMKAINDEIDNFEAPGVLDPILFKDIPKEWRKHIIDVYMFHREKFLADGTFDKDKCRIVTLSHLRDESTIGDTFSPTVNPITVLTQLNLAAVQDSETAAYDVKGAFLGTVTGNGIVMFIRVGGDLLKHWLQRYPERKKYVHSDGYLYFRLLRYAYGLHEAPHQFNLFLDKTLKNMGLVPAKADPCFYTKDTPDGKIRLSVHVDDMLLTCPSIKWRTWFEDTIEKQFTIVKQYGDISYLGIQIKKDPRTGDITLSQNGFLNNLLTKHKMLDIVKAPKTPATPTLMEHDPVSPAADKKAYLSLVMSLMYIARFTRPDIQFATSYLATRSSNPTEEDEAKLKRILKYLAGTQRQGLQYKSSVKFIPSIAADASHHLYDTGHGQMGMIISNGSSPVAHRSVKIKMITRSSSESELCALEEASTYAVWYSLLLHDMGLTNTKPITIHQDNKSAIVMAVQGATFRRTKHLIGRESFVKERIDNGDIKLSYLPTADMPADILTKPLAVASLNRLKDKMNMCNV